MPHDEDHEYTNMPAASRSFDTYIPHFPSPSPSFTIPYCNLYLHPCVLIYRCDFLPLDAQVHAIDTGLHPDRCSPCPLAEDVWGWYANSSDRVAMERVTTYLHHQQVSPPASSPLDHGRKRSGFDMIIDDGGHNPRDQLAAFNFLFHNDT